MVILYNKKLSPYIIYKIDKGKDSGRVIRVISPQL